MTMDHRLFLLACALALLGFSSPASSAIVEHTFHVQNLTVQRLCQSQVITAVNGRLPGPTIKVHEGDTLIIHVHNKSPYKLSIHWHGIFQRLSGWADGPHLVTQCPIRPGNGYTYRFDIIDQEGTLWWHAHFQSLRVTVYGALIIHPRIGDEYPFPKPYREYPIVLGEWWNANIFDVEDEALASGGALNNSDAYTINGQPGDLYPCSKDKTHMLTVEKGKTYLLRIINAALNTQLFFKIAHHKMRVVAVDASYTLPYTTDVVVIAPGQTTDVLLTANKSPGSYYIAARPYASAADVPFDNTTTTGIIVYKTAHPSVTPIMPHLPAFNDSHTAHKFSSSLTGLVNGPHWVPVPKNIDEHMFITINMGLVPCVNGPHCEGPWGQRFATSMNNESFVLPSKVSMLEAHFRGDINGIYTRDFPDNPPLLFDYTNPNNSNYNSILFPSKSTKVKKVKYNSTVEIVLQNTALLVTENHPMHLHGYNFHILAQGFGNYDPIEDANKMNLVNPQIRNTIGVPAGGWAVIRFRADNPGIWIMHCHLDVHLPWGLAMAFEVENGGTPSTTLPPPPSDFPKC